MSESSRSEKKLARYSPHKLNKIVWLLLGLVLLLLVLGRLIRFRISKARFFSKMERFHSMAFHSMAYGTSTEDYPLEHLKQIAAFLLEQPGIERRLIIASYSSTVPSRPNDTSASFDLFILNRLLFDVPDAHPEHDSRRFGGWIMPRRPECKNGECNLLWPLARENDRLILEEKPAAYFGHPYSVLREYDYFASRFPPRTIDELEVSSGFFEEALWDSTW